MSQYIAHVIAEYEHASGKSEETVLCLNATELGDALEELKNGIIGTPNRYCEFEPDISFVVKSAVIYEVRSEAIPPLVEWLSEKEAIIADYKENQRYIKRHQKYKELKAEFENES